MTLREKIEGHHNKVRSEYSDSTLLRYFKLIREQSKWRGRQIDTLIKYINELEFRGIKYRL